MSAGAPVQMGPNAVQNPQALMSALQSQQPAANPATPAERANPDQQVLEHIKAAAVSIGRARAYTNDPHMQMFFDLMEGSCNKALLKFDGSAVLQSLQEQVMSLPPMAVPAPGGQPQPMGGMPLGGSPGAPGSPMGGPSVPGAPGPL